MFHPFQLYNLFISHSWDYHQDYEKLIDWLARSNICYKNYSIPIEKELNVSRIWELKVGITDHIAATSVVILLAGMYANYSRWIDYEINEAIRMGKPILGVYPRGQERSPIKITTSADAMVHWNSSSFIQGLKSLL